MALASFSTILIFGGTSGIGESFARRFNAMGKKVIVTGRRQDRLDLLSRDLPGLETYRIDNTDVVSLASHLITLSRRFTEIDTVWVNSGVSHVADFKNLHSHNDDQILQEISLNLTAPIIIARHFIPHLLSLDRETHFLITGSGLGFLPIGMMPVYCATKAAVHSFMVSLRESVGGSRVRVIELAVPHVRTDFTKGIPGGIELEDFTNQTLEILETSPAKDIKEVGVAFGKVAAEAWRKAFGPMLESRGSVG